MSSPIFCWLSLLQINKIVLASQKFDFSEKSNFHHIHHLSPRIPNYHLQQCHNENPALQRVTRLTIKSSLPTVWLALWDEKQHRLVSFREALQTEPSMIHEPVMR